MRKLKRKSKRVKKERIIYEKKRCDAINRFGKQCKRNAVGRGNVCEKHGGERIVEESLMSVHESPTLGIITKFDPVKHPILFIELSMLGMSEVEIAAEIGVAPSNMKKWSEKYSEFAKAWELGKACYEAWWLRQGKSNLNNTRFQTGLYKFLTTNKLGYAEKIETKSHNINENVGVLLIPGQMSVEDWEKQNIEDEDAIEAEFTQIEE